MTNRIEKGIIIKRRMWKNYKNNRVTNNLNTYLEKEKEVEKIVRRTKKTWKENLEKAVKKIQHHLCLI